MTRKRLNYRSVQVKQVIQEDMAILSLSICKRRQTVKPQEHQGKIVVLSLCTEVQGRMH